MEENKHRTESSIDNIELDVYQMMDVILNVRDTVKWDTPLDEYILLSRLIKSLLNGHADRNIPMYIYRELEFTRVSKNKVIIITDFINALYTGDFTQLRTDTQYLDLDSEANAVLLPPINCDRPCLPMAIILKGISVKEFTRFLRLTLRLV